ncbi:hypothetical protein HaLaN_03129 [Haematococcus lacustris]|uniref:Uncharacterized protein n=1 Tax=Haematococcus lacustris TaxID=44745 RepID=A0A699YYN8_HAELA|nr:hypothetical protein HaLaN_03129 [Haematococcus lacustris]
MATLFYFGDFFYIALS